MPPDTILDDQEYGSSEEDSDFAPDVVPTEVSDESSDEETEPAEATVKKGKPKSTKRKRGPEDEAEDAGFENSGDEAIIEKGLKRQKKKKNKEVDDEDEGGEGGLIKTRSMRALEYELLFHARLQNKC
jgi:hypothetical protein